MGNHSDTGDELDEIYDSSATDPGTNPSELDDDNGEPVKLNPDSDGSEPNKKGPSPNSGK